MSLVTLFDTSASELFGNDGKYVWNISSSDHTKWFINILGDRKMTGEEILDYEELLAAIISFREKIENSIKRRDAEVQTRLEVLKLELENGLVQENGACTSVFEFHSLQICLWNKDASADWWITFDGSVVAISDEIRDKLIVLRPMLVNQGFIAVEETGCC